MYKMQQMVGMVGMYEATEDEEYVKMKEIAKNLREACKKVHNKMEDVAEGSHELVKNMKTLSTCMLDKYLLNKESTGTEPPNTILLNVARDLGGMEFGEKEFSAALKGCRNLIIKFDAELKKLEEYREERRGKKETYDYYRYELKIKQEDLDRRKKPYAKSNSYLKKKAKCDEAHEEYVAANEIAKRHMMTSIQQRDAILANLLQSYLKSCSTFFLSLHTRFAQLHDCTVARISSPLPSPRTSPLSSGPTISDETMYS